MKKFISLFILVLFISNTYSQQADVIDSLFQTPQQQFDYITANLDLSEINSGLLADKALVLIPLNQYHGDSLTSINLTSHTGFEFMYASLSGMPISSNYYLPDPSTYINTAENSSSTNTYLGAIHYEYNYLDTNAITNNLLTSNGQQLFDVPNRPNSPYLEKEVFLVTPLKKVLRQKQTNFIFSDSLFYTNTNKTISNIEVDFDNGAGFIKVNMNSPISVSYVNNGDKVIKTRISYSDQSVYVAHARLNVNEVIVTRDYELSFTHPILATTDHFGELGSANLEVFLGCGHSNIQKPLIWVEGFNPLIIDGATGDIILDESYDSDYMLNNIISKQIPNPDNTNSVIAIRDLLLDESYDLIYVNFTNGSDSMQKNAYAVVRAIEWVNEQKAKNGSLAKNIVLGESMGGVIARYALRKMEIAGEDHETSMYFSLDSPHQGANIPLSAQYAVKHIPHINTILNKEIHEFFSSVPLLAGERLMNEPAAKQLLIYQALDDFSNQTGGSLKSSSHTYFFDEYSAMGPLQNTKTFLSSNGSDDGLGQGVDPGDEMFKI